MRKPQKAFSFYFCFVWGILVLLASFLVSCSANAPAVETGSSVSKVRVVMDNNYPPYVFAHENGEYQGISIDQWKLWEQRTGVSVEITALPWGEALSRMEAGEFDVIDTIFYTEDRAEIFDFTDSYAQIDVPIFFHKNISGIADAEDLRGFRVAVKAGDANAEYLLEHGITSLVYYDSYEEIIKAVVEKRETIFVIDQPPAMYFLYKYGIQDQFHYSEPLYGGAFHRAVKKGDAELLSLVNAGFRQISPAEYQAISNRWLGTGQTSGLQELGPFLGIIAAFAVVIIFVLFAFNQILRSRVQKRTSELEDALSRLQKNELRFRTAIDFLPIPISVAKKDGQILLVNQKFIQEYGYTLDDIPSIEMWVSFAYPDPVYREKVLSLWNGDVARSIQDGEATPLREYKVTCKDGSQRDVEILMHPIGELLVASFNNVTERKRAEEALRENEVIFSSFLEHSPVYVFFKDKNIRPIRLSKNYEQMLGMPISYVLGKTMDELFPSDLAKSMVADDLRILNEGRRVDVVEELNGRVYETTKFPIYKDDQPFMLAGFTLDITERKHNEDLVRENEKRFRTLLENGTDALTLLGADGTVIYEGPTVQKLTGFSVDERVGKNSLENIFPDDLPLIRSILAEILISPGDSASAIFRSIRKDGSIWWTEGTATNLLHDPSVQAIVVNYRDITARKQAEEKLRESEARYRTLFEQANDAIFIENTADQIVDVNRRACEILGYTRDELLKMRVADVIAPEINRGNHAIQKELAIYGSKPFESVDIHKDGRHVPVEVTNSVVSETLTISIVRDITERKHAESELRSSENRFRILFEHAGMGVAQTETKTGRFIRANQRYCEIVGYPREELETITYQSITHPDDLPVDQINMQQLIDGEISEFKLEKRYIRKDGTLVWVVLVVSPLWLPGEPPEMHIGVIHDITEQKRTEYALRYSEAEVRKLNAELERRVIERTSQLEAANKELEAFAYSVSHDLRAPLRAIDGFSRILIDEHAERLNADALALIDRVRSANQNMNQLVDALLGLSRMTRAEIRRESIDMSLLVRKVIENLRQANPNQNVEFVIASDIFVDADMRLLSVALENLLGNAWKFTSRRNQAYVEFGVEQRDGEKVYFIRDNGAGFDMTYAGKLFGAFQRLHTSSEFEGTGIGLATVQRIIHRHGGRVWAEGEIDKGATFYFTLG